MGVGRLTPGAALPSPVVLVVELPGEHADQVGVLRELAGATRAGGLDLWAWAPSGRVACLEPGAVASGLLLGRAASREVARGLARDVVLPRLQRALPRGTAPVVLVADALPDEGLPSMMSIPTRASVPLPSVGARHHFLLIRGSAWEQARLDAYRDVILPMHFERGGLYESFAIQPGQVEALSGEWREQIFAVSRWPSRAASEDFWYSERYQTQAIPLRIGAGRFTVHALAAAEA